jgi:hypothetical protein
MKSFYDFYTKLQKLHEENDLPLVDPKVMNNAPPTDSAPSPEQTEETPKLIDKSKESTSEEESNLSPPEGKINYKYISKNLKHISKFLPKFKNLDQEKGEQLEQLLDQISNLVNSFEGGSEQDNELESESDKEVNVEQLPDESSADLNTKTGTDNAGQEQGGSGVDLTSSLGLGSSSSDQASGSMPQGMNPLP